MFLRSHDIPAASKNQQNGRLFRRKRKSLPGGVPFPMKRHSAVYKKELIEEVQSGKISEGIPVVPTIVPSFSYNSAENEVSETTSTVSAKISLFEVRKKLLEKHESLGLIRNLSSSPEQNENLEPNSIQGVQRTRYLKIWHDHSSVAGHGHFLVLVSVIYDSEFYLTQEEVNLRLEKDIDVQSTVKTPELHIFGQSSSSIEDQALFCS